MGGGGGITSDVWLTYGGKPRRMNPIVLRETKKDENIYQDGIHPPTVNDMSEWSQRSIFPKVHNR
jgi:hypothetical protein